MNEQAKYTPGPWETLPEECDKVNQRMAGLLTRIAAALKGDPGPHRMHSWHDLPDLAAQAMQAARATQSAQLIRPAPAAREPLTDDQIEELWVEHGLDECDPAGFARAIEAAHGITAIAGRETRKEGDEDGHDLIWRYKRGQELAERLIANRYTEGSA